MNQRKRLITAREILEKRFLSQQKQVAKHACYLSIWYRAHRVPLWLSAFSITAGLTYLRHQWRQPFIKNKPWVRRTRLGALWLLDFIVFNPRMLHKLLRYVLMAARQEQRVARKLNNAVKNGKPIEHVI